MKRPRAAMFIPASLAMLVALFTIWLSYTQLKQPADGWNIAALLDWAALILSGFTTGIITFFVAWGHFQSDPEPPSTNQKT